MFDSIIEIAKSKLGLGGDQAGSVLAALLRYAADPANGGFSAFLDKFRSAGLSSVVDSWIGGGTGEAVTAEQFVSAIGSEAVGSIASDAGVSNDEASAAIATMMPGLVDKLTPDAELPDDDGIFSKVGGFLSDWGSSIGGAVLGGAAVASAVAGSAADKVGDVTGAAYHKGKEVLGGGLDAIRNVGEPTEKADDGPVLRWLLPIILLGVVVGVGYMFCGNPQKPASNLANTNANPNANPNTNISKPAVNVPTNAVAGLVDVVLPDGTKLQAHPGGIEDQMVKFIGSDEYKNATQESLKDKWFNFDDLTFKFGSAELEDSSKRQLDNIVAILKAFPEAKIKIGAYTDKKGDDAANLKLSDGRAKTVKAALDKAGVGGQVVDAEGYGEQHAAVDENASDDERKADRKTAIRFVK
ncbi:MAG: OmpA family protein [Pyrinomonadaceae bacterium]|nr:OmpA family protein [Pyrinomonadaceae bacterium]